MNPVTKRRPAAASMINVNTFAPSRSMLTAATTTRRTAKAKQVSPRFCQREEATLLVQPRSDACVHRSSRRTPPQHAGWEQYARIILSIGGTNPVSRSVTTRSDT